MRSIVVNKIIVLTGFLLLATGVTAQKPAIDLISSHQHYKHPESIIDTGKTLTPLVREPALLQVSPAQDQHLKNETEKKRSHQIAPSLDSIFRKYYSLRIYIYITALK